MNLNKCILNKIYLIKKLMVNENTKNKLNSLGIINGMEIKVIFRSGSGSILQVMDSRVAIDNEVAHLIEVENENSTDR